MSLTPPSSHTSGGLAFTGWTEDSSDPANVDSGGGDLTLESGALTAHGGVFTTGGAVTLAGGNLVTDDGTNLGRVAANLLRTESDTTNEGYEARIGSGITSSPPAGVAGFTVDPSASGTIALDAGGLVVIGFQGLPTTDPGSPGALYTTAGALMVSL